MKINFYDYYNYNYTFKMNLKIKYYKNDINLTV